MVVVLCLTGMENETDLAGETCVVCLETYKPREVVRILTCRHVFHKRCIDRWFSFNHPCSPNKHSDSLPPI
uniref:RING-type domain-containing protein n=1 Tax=Podarcis muralis TaxID=64176 RepID=A0A670JA11_PODMU